MTAAAARKRKPICDVDVEDGLYVGNGRDGVYYDATQGPDGWYTSSIVDSDTGHFVDSLVTDDGPYPSAAAALEGGWNGATDWCINNTVRFNMRETTRARRRRAGQLQGVAS